MEQFFVLLNPFFFFFPISPELQITHPWLNDVLLPVPLGSLGLTPVLGDSFHACL